MLKSVCHEEWENLYRFSVVLLLYNAIAFTGMIVLCPQGAPGAPGPLGARGRDGEKVGRKQHIALHLNCARR